MFSRPGLRFHYADGMSLTLAIVLAVSISHPSTAEANWRVVPAVGIGFQYDDNASLLPDSAADTSVNGYLLDAEAQFIYETQLTDFSLVPSILLNRFDESLLDSEDYFLDMTYKYTGQRSMFEIWGTYADESVRTAERANVDLDVEDPELIPDDNSGRVLFAENRQRLKFRPRWSLKTGERSSFRIGANYIDVTYDNTVSQFLIDYSQLSGDVTFETEVSERSAFLLNGYYRENDFSIASSDFSGYGATVGLNRSLSERTRFIANVGAESSEDDFGANETNTVGDVSLIHKSQTSQFLASYRRSISGSGTGILSLRDSVNLNFTRKLSPKVSIGAGVAAYSTSALDAASASVEDRDYIQLRARLSRKFTRVFSVDLDYRYTSIDREISSADAESNRVDLWFRYRPDR